MNVHVNLRHMHMLRHVLGWVGGWVCGCVGVWVCGCGGGCVGVWVCGCVCVVCVLTFMLTCVTCTCYVACWGRGWGVLS